MSYNVMKIMCPKCMEVSEYEYPNNMMFVKKDDFTTDLLNQGYTKGYNKAIDDFEDMLLEWANSHQCRLDRMDVINIANRLKGE